MGASYFITDSLVTCVTNTKGNFALPLQFEPIERDGVDTQYSKNDCELNAAKRLLQKMKVQFPKRSFCFLADNFFGIEPIVDLMLKKSWHFVITAKPERNKELFSMYEYLYERRKCYDYVDIRGFAHRYRWTNKLPLKVYQQNEIAIHVNLLEYDEINPEGEIIFKSSWMTDFEITQDNAGKLALAGRARFVIENRNFNEQKNLGFHTEHNFGHFGNLPNVFFGLAGDRWSLLPNFFLPGKLANLTSKPSASQAPLLRAFSCHHRQSSIAGR